MNARKLIAALVGGTALAAGLVGASTPASAEPQGAPTYRDLAGVGSDTTQGVVNGLSQVVTISGTKVIASYDATGGGTIQTKTPVGGTDPCLINRPNGSGAGRTALVNSINANGGAGDGCIQFARSSSLGNGTTGTQILTYVPFAVDALTFAVTSTSNIPRSMTTADLTAYYHCDPNYVGSPATIHPIVPNQTSGTRSFFIGKVGLAEADIPPLDTAHGGCLINSTTNSIPVGQPGAGTLIEEHDGRVLDNNSIVPMSIAQWISQETGTLADIRGRSVLGVLDGKAPLLLQTNFGAFKRDVYNVIPTSKTGTAPWSTVFVGASSLVCTNTATIQSYGFGVAANCGDTSTTRSN